MPNVGSILEVSPGSYQNEFPVEKQGVVAAATANTITLDGAASSVNGAYVGMWVTIVGKGGYDPIVTAYNGATKVCTLDSQPSVGFANVWPNGTPVAGDTYKIVSQYPVQKDFVWQKDGVDIVTGLGKAIGASYTPSVAGSYTYKETAYRPTSANNFGSTATYVSSASVVTGTRVSDLVYASDFTYLGAFAYPSSMGIDGSYAGPIAYNPAGNGGAGSLFVRGHQNSNQVAEISIPSQASWAQSDAAPVPQGVLLGGNYGDPLEGQLLTSGITSGGVVLIKGLMVYGGKLYVTAHGDYTYNSASWFWRRPLSLTTTGALEGPFSIAGPSPWSNERWWAGYMSPVPTSLQAKLGGPVIAGLSAQSIVTATSDGPAIGSFAPSSLDGLSAIRGTVPAGATQTSMVIAAGSATSGAYVNWRIVQANGAIGTGVVTAYDGATKIATIASWGAAPTPGAGYALIPRLQGIQLAKYASGELQYGVAWGHTGVFNWTGRDIAGVCVPNGTRSVLAFGKCGNGLYNYGISYISNGGIRQWSNSDYSDTPGEKAYPYIPRIWCYNTDELEQVRLGNVQPNAVKPYAVINFNFPFKTDGIPTGVAWDGIGRRLFLTTRGLPYGNMVVHVYTITNAVAE